MSDCTVKFWKSTDDKSGTGDHRTYSGPQSVPDLNEIQWEGESHDDMKDDASWVDTSSQAWVRIYSKDNYQGRTVLIGPNQHVSLKKLQDENNEDDMNDTVESIQIYDHPPSVNTTNILNNFVALYPFSERSTKNNLYNSEWYAQDSEYRVYDPSILQTSDSVAFSVKLDHIQSESDDHATLTFSMDFSGDFVEKIQVTYDIANATQIPDWVINLTDKAIWVAEQGAKVLFDSAVIVITDGIGTVATIEINKVIKYTAKALTFCVDHLNFVLGAVFKLQDDGGRTNFPAIVSHSIARLVLAYYQELYGKDTNTPLTFVENAYFDGLKSNNSWDDSKHSLFVLFKENNRNYRSYFPDNTFLYARGGAVSSVKIDSIENNEKDDHLVLQAIFTPKGALFSVAGCMDIFSVKNSSDYTPPASGVLARNSEGKIIHIEQGQEEFTVLENYDSIESAYADMMKKALEANATQFDYNLSDQQRTLVTASVTALNAMTAAIQ